VPLVTQLDEERWHLWEMAKANLVKAQKRYKDVVHKSQREINFEEVNDVWLNIKKIVKRYDPQVLKLICRSIQSVRKEIS
jgi:hypothetical protein